MKHIKPLASDPLRNAYQVATTLEALPGDLRRVVLARFKVFPLENPVQNGGHERTQLTATGRPKRRMSLAARRAIRNGLRARRERLAAEAIEATKKGKVKVKR